MDPAPLTCSQGVFLSLRPPLLQSPPVSRSLRPQPPRAVVLRVRNLQHAWTPGPSDAQGLLGALGTPQATSCCSGLQVTWCWSQ